MPRADFSEAQKNKKDEFYTQLADIEEELRHYKKHFEGKVVLCNCDDPFESNFFKFFALNFEHLKLKKLICTSYAGSTISHTEITNSHMKKKNEKMPYMIEITETPDLNGDGTTDISDIELLLRSNNNVLTLLDGDGDFRSDECIGFLKEADIVVTNPPFSLFREYIAQLMEYDKKFVILGNMNAITYKEFFPLIKNNQIWSGYGFNKSMIYKTPYPNKLEANRKFVISKGKNPDEGYVKVPAICWFTNLDIERRHDEIKMYKKYSPEDYPHYGNYNAINVDKVVNIPSDYYGAMGVPITFLDKYNPDQFEILGLAPDRGTYRLQTKRYKNAVQHNKNGSVQGGNKVNDGPVIEHDTIPKKYPYYTAENSDKKLEVLYARIIIKRKATNEN